MSANRLEVIHYSNKRCKHSESVDLKINNKTLVSPIFAPRLKNSNELNIYLEMKSKYTPFYLSAYVVRLFDVGKTLLYRLKKVSQKNLLGETIDPVFSSSLEQDLVLIDPAFDYLYYIAKMERLAHSPYMSPIIRKYAKDFIKERTKIKNAGKNASIGVNTSREILHTNFWSCMYKEPSKRMKLIRDTFHTERKYHADLFIPPVPLVTSNHLLRIAISMNEKSQAYAEGKVDCADYFILKPNVLTNERMMATIKQYIENSSNPLTIFKFKNLNLNHEDCSLERRAFRELLEELIFLSQHVDNKAFAFFEAGNQTFVSALSSVAFVSTAFNLDREDYRRSSGGTSPFASWYDPETMTLRNKKSFTTVVENNNGKIPCFCPVCSSSHSFINEKFTEYNNKTKEHFLHIREQEMKEIYDAIEKQDALMGFDKIKRSSLKNIVDVIPRS